MSIQQPAFSRFATVLVLAMIIAMMLGASSDSQRYDKLGHRMMCMCGCNQILLECNHVGCQVSGKMTEQLKTTLAQGQTDDSIIQKFTTEYGPVVLAAPLMTGFGRVAWVTPPLLFLLGIGGVAAILVAWKRRPQSVATAVANAPEIDDFRRQAREETQI
jgi:cytochrome c-type biogenesis protein CcmH/NrfF